MLTRTASEILPRLWLSGWYTAVDEEQLLKLGVTHILSIIDAKPRYPRGKFKTMHVQLQDIENADILRHLDATTAFIRNALEDERNVVLVRTLTLFPLPLFAQISPRLMHVRHG